ncbi:MAG: malate dehydrogenase [Candidatus Omnitrophica bacterium CG11_big_fil_rev_8_21_14_0_20_63_9]|nr:MAG: malate dehydrogenase [Candidatus Omnitrophica bacterium CG11_big_fil_rev_8_21_14_0_20_63_9]
MSLPRVTVIGAGQVGATTAHLLALKGLADVVLIDVVDGLAQGKALDMMQSAPVEGFVGRLTGTTDWAALADSRVVVVTAGLARKPGMSRDDLLAANANIVGPIAERIAAGSPKAIIVVVTNPLDVMVALALRRSKFPKPRVIGMAGILDSARLRTVIAQRLDTAPSAVQAMILGSHGDMMVALRSSITVNGKPLTGLLPAAEITQLIDRAKNGGAEIVSLLKTGSAFYAPASSAVQMVDAILNDRHVVLPVCAWLEGEYGLRDVCIGVPAQLSAQGIERVVEMPLAAEERSALHAAAEQVKAGIKSLANIQPAGARA